MAAAVDVPVVGAGRAQVLAALRASAPSLHMVAAD